MQTDRLLVAAEVEMVIPESDPSEPFPGSETVALLQEVHDRVVDGDMTWLKKEGKLNRLVAAA